MAEKGGIVEDVLGGGEAAEAPEADAQPALDPVAAAVAIDAAGDDPDVARDLKAYLGKQARLVEIQTEHLHEQRAVLLSTLKLRRSIDRLRLGLQLFAVLVATTIGLGLLVMLADAFNSRSVVVESFDAPPALAARGLSGKVVAGGVLDALTRLQQATRSSAARRNLANAWTSDIKIEVPETGVSIGEIDRLLKARFGRDIHIDGDLVQTEAGGLALTIRGDDVAPKTFEGAAGELDKLTTQAAEYVYGQSQPALYAAYLNQVDRIAEALDFSKGAYPSAPETDRPYLLNSWATALVTGRGDQRAALPLYREALRLKPDYWSAYNNLIAIDQQLGDEEGALRLGEAMTQKAGGRPGRAPEIDYQNVDLLDWNLLAWRAATLADAKANAGVGSNITGAAAQLADIDARLHDGSDTAIQLQTAQAASAEPIDAALVHFVRGRLAQEAGDTATAAVEMEAFQAAYANPAVAANLAGYDCWVAPAEEAADRPDKADAVLKAGGRFVDCYRFHGDILDHRGDWAGARKAYAEAVAIAPDLPAAYYSWGLALVRHGDLAGALVKFAAANQRGPHWADPLKAWGDVLARQKRWTEALAKYDEALTWAPAWAELKQARARAAARAEG